MRNHIDNQTFLPNVLFLQTFCCPGATSFYVEFDPRCETERKYDFLEFTDFNGIKSHYDQKVGTASWPLNVTFKGGHRLHFLFHSDSSNNEWGYKFKVIAKGAPDIPLCWMYDLQLSVARLFGELCGATVRVPSSSCGIGKSDAAFTSIRDHLITDGDDWEDEETLLLHSELWSTLFRSGYVTSHAIVRSLSGWHSTGVGGKGGKSASPVFEFLGDMIKRDEDATGKEAVVARDFLLEVKSKFSGLSAGGAILDDAVVTIFAALVWHAQGLREELDKTLDGKVCGEKVAVSEGLQQVWDDGFASCISAFTHFNTNEQVRKVEINAGVLNNRKKC